MYMGQVSFSPIAVALNDIQHHSLNICLALVSSDRREVQNNAIQRGLVLTLLFVCLFCCCCCCFALPWQTLVLLNNHKNCGLQSFSATYP